MRLTALVAVLVACAGCAEDRVLPVDSRCGDGVRSGAEECDVDAPGCAACRVERGYTCDETSCRNVCGDGVVVGAEQCDPPDGTSCDSFCAATSKAERCDMGGYWAVRQTDFNVDTVLRRTQTAANWYLLRIAQSGERFEVVQSVSCGTRVTGSVEVDLDDRGRRAMLWKNAMDGRPDGTGKRRLARHGSFFDRGASCELRLSRHYFVRGVEDRFLPEDFDQAPALTALSPLPTEDNPEYASGRPYGQDLEGALDVDADGFPGLAWYLTGTLSGIRNTAQRDWSEYGPRPEYTILPNAIEFTTGSFFDNEEQILHVRQCPALGCSLVTAGSRPAADKPHRVLFRYLGRSLDEPRVAATVAAPLLVNEEDDLASCARVREQLPYERVEQ